MHSAGSRSEQGGVVRARAGVRRKVLSAFPGSSEKSPRNKTGIIQLGTNFPSQLACTASPSHLSFVLLHTCSQHKQWPHASLSGSPASMARKGPLAAFPQHLHSQEGLILGSDTRPPLTPGTVLSFRKLSPRFVSDHHTDSSMCRGSALEVERTLSLGCPNGVGTF